jgi:thiosulfate/3-mercaptopyruvate sulfurtransferase
LLVGLFSIVAFTAQDGRAAVCTACTQEADWAAGKISNFLENEGLGEKEPELPTKSNPQMAREANPKFNKSLAKNATNPSSSFDEGSPQAARAAMASYQGTSGGSYVNGNMMVSPAEVARSDVVLDVSDNALAYIDGAVHITYTEFVDSSVALKPIPELAQILGQAGISQDDPLVVYGKCIPCGGITLHAATYAYWMLSYLGHKNLRLLDGGLEAWEAEGFKVQETPSQRPATTYQPNPRHELLATYDYVNSVVKSGAAQIVDARDFQTYGAGKIPGAINIPYDSVLQDGRIKDAASLEEIFGGRLSKEKPVVVYTNTGVKASLMWFALSLMGYDARLYSWDDWLDHQPTLDLELDQNLTRAEPNPAVPGPVKIYAVFRPGQGSSVSAPSEEGQTVLHTQGCATCEPITLLARGTLTQDKKPGMQLGSYGKTSGGDFSCQAVVSGQWGEVATVSMERTQDDEFMGTWNASGINPGIYKVDFVATASGYTRTFKDAISLEILGLGKESTGFQNLG